MIRTLLQLAKVEPVSISIFKHEVYYSADLSQKCRHSESDMKSIDLDIERLLRVDAIEESRSPWRVHVLVVSNDNHKKRMVVDDSQTTNKYAELDAVNYEVISKIDFRGGNHQVLIRKEDRTSLLLKPAANCGNLN